MHPVRKQRLINVLFIVFGSTLAVGLAVFAMRENINLFYPPSKIVSGEAPIGKTIRAGGCVVPGSIVRDSESLKVSFDVTGGGDSVTIQYEGLLPDLFAEGEAAVATGKLGEDGIFVATEVLAKHDENYTPVEVEDTLAEEAQDYAQHAKTCEGLDYGS